MVVFAVISVIAYRVTIMAVAYQVGDSWIFFGNVKLFVTCTAAALNLITIVVLNKVNVEGCSLSSFASIST